MKGLIYIPNESLGLYLVSRLEEDKNVACLIFNYEEIVQYIIDHDVDFAILHCHFFSNVIKTYGSIDESYQLMRKLSERIRQVSSKIFILIGYNAAENDIEFHRNRLHGYICDAYVSEQNLESMELQIKNWIKLAEIANKISRDNL